MDKDKTTLFYYAENAKELRKIIDGQLVTFGGISDFDKDDFYSIGNEVFTSALNSYVDGKGVPFKAYLTLCLKNKIKQEMTKRNTAKRKAELTSIDEFEDFDVRADGNLEEEILSDESAKEYYNSLTDLGRKIVSLRMANVSDVEIREWLGITTRKLDSEVKRMKRMIKTKTETERTNSARRTARPINEGEELNMSIAPDYRDDYLSLALLKDKIEAGELLLSHPNQRNDWQWSPIDISTLICTNLHGFRINPIIVCEESLEDGTILNWIIDGKQRVTAMLNFAYPEDPSKPFKISPKTEYTEIPYQAQVKSEDGTVIRDELGRPVLETKVFDIKGKKFDDFPVELQRKFVSYVFTVTRYVNCDKDMISYHIRRYNKGKAMNAAQKANTYLSEDIAYDCEKVATHPFFDNVGFSENQIRNGASKRVVIEAVMAMNYRDDWKKNTVEAFTFFNKNGDSSDLELVNEYLTRLDDVLDDDTRDLFTIRNAYLFIALFHTFAGMGLDDSEFNDFLLEFVDSLHSVKVKEANDRSFDDEKTGSTKDKGYVEERMTILETLMGEYFGEKKVA